MKKILLITAISLFVLSSTKSQAQEDGFLVGLNYGVPVGDLHDIALFNVGADLSYLFNLSETFQVGPLVGYSSFIRKGSNEISENYKFVPLAGTIRANISEHLMLGGDIGYGYGINDELDGGIFYRPKVGYLTEYGNLTLSYTGIHSNDTTFSTINIGVEFNL